MIGTEASDSTLLITVGLPNRPLMRRQRRLGAHLAALAFEALEQRGLLAADVGAGADPHLEVEARARAARCCAPSMPAARARRDRRASCVAIACGYSERM